MQKKGLITKTVDVGFMELALFVQKGNPKNVKADVAELLRPDLKVVIGASNSGSIGKETRFCLQKQSLYNAVSRKVIYLTTDSKGLVQALRKGNADVVLNWRAVAYAKDNAEHMDEIRLPPEQVAQRRLAIGILASSKSPDISSYFLELAASTSGREIFSRNGL
jgi:molybdate transport system substrate-binding protein